MSDIDSLSKEFLRTKAPDTPDIIKVLVPSLSPDAPREAEQFEPYIRLRSLPSDLMKIVLNGLEANNLSEKIAAAVPGLGKAQPTYHPNGITEIQWRLDDGSIFGLIISGFSFSTDREPYTGKITAITNSVKILWRFHGPKHPHQTGEFKTVTELMDFVSKSFVTREE